MKKVKLLVTTLVSILVTCGCKNEVSSSTSSNTSSSIISSSLPSVITYEVCVKAINGNILKNVTVDVYKEDTLIETVKTDFYGTAKITLEKGEYTAKLKNLPSGMYSEEIFILKEGEVNNLVCYANPIDESVPAKHLYNPNDLMYDFSFFDSNSKKVKLSTLLENKKAVVLNFWGTTCVPCQEEFPLFQQLYNEYSNDIEIVALSVEDGIKSVADFKLDNDYSFIMGVDLGQSIFKTFLTYFGDVSTGSYSIPGTVFIDKYGFINKIHSSSYATYGSLQTECLNVINKY